MFELSAWKQNMEVRNSVYLERGGHKHGKRRDEFKYWLLPIEYVKSLFQFLCKVYLGWIEF